MRYIVHHLSHMPVGGRFCVSRLKIVPGFDGGPIEVHDTEFDPAYYPTRKVAAAAQRGLSANARHPVYGLRQLEGLDDSEVADWLRPGGTVTAVAQSGEAPTASGALQWFNGLSEEDKTRYRVEFMNAQPTARRLSVESAIGVDLTELALVADMARSHIDDIREGLNDGTYNAEENADINQKATALGKLEGFIAANL